MAEKKEVKPTKKASPARRTRKTTPVKVETPAPAVEAPVSVSESPTKKSLPGIGSLFQASWDLFKSSFFSYFKLVLVGIATFAVGVIVTILLTLPLMLLTGGSADQLFDSPSALEIVLIVLLVAWMLVFILGIITLSIMMPVLYLLILGSEKKLSIKELFQKAKPLVWAFLFVELLAGIAVLGGLGALVIPGILFAIYFIFVANVMVFENRRGTDALTRSYALVKNNFWEIVVRVLILQLILFAVSYVLNTMSEQSDVATFLSIVFSLFAEWFGAVFMYLLYKHIRDRKAVDANVSMSWIWIVSGIGLVVWTVLLSQLISGVISGDNLLLPGDTETLTDPNSLESI